MIQQTNLSLESQVVQVKGNIVSDMGGEKVMLSIQNGKYYNLGAIGGDIWDHLQEPILVGELVAKLQADYEVERAQCERDVLAFLEMLWKEGLIEVSEPMRE